jgi:hypothetical protein
MRKSLQQEALLSGTFAEDCLNGEDALSIGNNNNIHYQI